MALTVAAFVFGVWSLSYYASRLLRDDLIQLIGGQQSATVSAVAAEINANMEERLKALEFVAVGINLPMLEQPAILQVYLDQRPLITLLFNAGAFITRLDGVAVAEVPRIGRTGINYLDRDHVAAALRDGKASVGKAVIGKKVASPSFAMTVPIRDTQGNVIGALTGATDLSVTNFLDNFVASRYGLSGGYLIVDPVNKLFVTTTSNANYEKLVMQPIPAPGVNPVLDRRLEGFDGAAVNVSSLGIEVLTSSARIPFPNWFLIASLPTQEAFTPVSSLQRQLALVTIFLTLIMGSLIWWLMSRHLRQQFAPMLAATEALNNSLEIDATPNLLPINNRGEVGALLQSFNQLLTALARREQTEKENNERIRTMFERATDGILLMSPDGDVLAVNEAFASMHGYSKQEILAMCISDLDTPKTAIGLRERMRSAESGRSLVKEVSHHHKDGHDLILEVSSSMVEIKGQPCIQAFYRDITDRKNLEIQVVELAYRDSVTGLPNRHLLTDRLTKALAATSRDNQFAALMYIDLDNFKSINDTMGHQAGDKLLKMAAGRLTENLRQIDTVARLGGDEFVVMIEYMGNSPEIAAIETDRVATKILMAFRKVFIVDEKQCYTTASIGLTLFSGASNETVESVLKQADLAMYAAKNAGRNTIRFYDVEMQAVARENAELEADLRIALNENQFRLYYQPQVDAMGHPIATEALLRWQHPTRGLLLPGEFIPYAEQMGLILPIGDWVLHTACEQLVIWANDPFMSRLTLSINVNAHQFHETDFVEKVVSAVVHSGANQNHLEIEITEGVLIKDIQNTIVKIQSMRDRGIRFSLDDFGTGYSSLSYLQRLPFDQIKIDKSFVDGVPGDSNACAIVHMILALGKTLDVKVIAEGVETEPQRNFLETAGCRFFQGYVFGHPMPSEEFTIFMRANQQR